MEKTGQWRDVYLEQDFSQRAYHVKGAVLFPGVRGGVCENLVTEAHSLLQHLNNKKNILLFSGPQIQIIGIVLFFLPLKRVYIFNTINKKMASPLSSCCRQ